MIVQSLTNLFISKVVLEAMTAVLYLAIFIKIPTLYLLESPILASISEYKKLLGFHTNKVRIALQVVSKSLKTTRKIISTETQDTAESQVITGNMKTRNSALSSQIKRHGSALSNQIKRRKTQNLSVENTRQDTTIVSSQSRHDLNTDLRNMVLGVQLNLNCFADII